jgi:hypothetical protein
MQSGDRSAKMRRMSNIRATMQSPAVYRLRVQGHVPLDWSSRMMGMNITTGVDPLEECSTLVGRLPDQSALAGVLNTLFEKQYPLLSIECLEVG